jgi:energy-coupling factor transporter ATP-binding protein EcfA2
VSAPPCLEASLTLLVGGRSELRLRLAPGELVLLRGPPGCGKTTVLRCLAGLLHTPLAQGELRLLGHSYRPAGPCPPRVAWVQQDPYRGFLQPTVLEELASLEDTLPDDHLDRHLRQLGLDPTQDPRDLSLGEAWRLALEAALHRYPALLLLDEPTGSLDGPGLAWMAERLRIYLGQGGCIVVAEHRPEALGTLPSQQFALPGAAGVAAPQVPNCPAHALPPASTPVLLTDALEAEPGGSRRVGPLSLALHAGERVGLAGPNGCGKTTLLRTMAGLEPISAGHLSGLPWRGLDATPDRHGARRTRRRRLRHLRRRLRKARLPRGLGLLPQRPDDLLFRPSVAAELAASHQRCPALLGLLGLELDPRQDPITTSHGQRLMLATACVLGSLPPVVLLDEPSAWLDADSEARLFRALDHLQQHHGVAVLVASHDPDLLERHCGRVVTLEAARAVGPTPADRPDRALPARSDGAVLAVLGLSVAALAVVAATRSLPLLWLEVALLMGLLPTTPGWRRSMRRVLKRGGTLLLASSAVLCLLRGWPAGLALGLLATGKALGAWLPAAVALRSIRRPDLRRLLTRVAGPRLGLAATMCINAAPLVERVAARAWELSRLRRVRTPLAVLVPVLLRILSLATAQADMVTLRSAAPGAPTTGDPPCPQPSD